VSQLAPVTGLAVWYHRTAVIDGDRKLLVDRNGVPIVYDLGADGAERLPAAPSALEAARVAALDRYEAFTSRLHATSPAMDEATRARLQALGYVAAP
jgi:hypothetical protein